MRRLTGLAAVAVAFLIWGVVSAARAQDETINDDAVGDDADIEAGELGSLEEDVPVPRQRGVAPPRIVVDPSVRASSRIASRLISQPNSTSAASWAPSCRLS